MSQILSDEDKDKLDNYLLNKYQKDRATADEGIKQAKFQNNLMQIGDVVGDVATNIRNGDRSKKYLYNGIENLAATPREVDPGEDKWDGSRLRAIGQSGVDQALAAKNQVGKDIAAEQEVRGFDRSNRLNKRNDAFEGEGQDQKRTEWQRTNAQAPLDDQFKADERGQKRTEWTRTNTQAPLEDAFKEDERGAKRAGFQQDVVDRTRKNKVNAYEDQDMDTQSSISKNANNLFKSLLLNKADEAERAGAGAAAKQLRAQAASSNMDAREAYNNLKIMKDLDYSDILKYQAEHEKNQIQKKAAGAKSLDPMVLKASQELSSHQDMQNAFGGIDKALGMPLDKLQTKGGDVYGPDGKYKDLPGVSVPFLGRQAFDSAGQDFQAAAAKVFNTVIKNAAGTAVSSSEMERIREQFQNGRFNTEGGLVRALQDYKKAATEAMRNQEAGFSPEVIGTYRQRGGKTTDDYKRAEQKAEVGRQYNAKLNKTRIQYSDGSHEDIDGKQARRQ